MNCPYGANEKGLKYQFINVTVSEKLRQDFKIEFDSFSKELPADENGVDVNEYMPYQTLVMDIKQPLTLTQTTEKFDVYANVNGGGTSGQAGAIRLGIARALLEASNNEYRPVLKANGMLTRDARSKERKKYGLKAARRAPQFSKR